MKPRLSVVQEGFLRGVWICRGGPHRFGLGTTPRSAYDSWVAGMPPLERAEARGEADAIRIKAEAVAKQGGAEYVQLQAIAKWDGKLPVTSAGGAVPFINVK